MTSPQGDESRKRKRAPRVIFDDIKVIPSKVLEDYLRTRSLEKTALIWRIGPTTVKRIVELQGGLINERGRPKDDVWGDGETP